MALTTDERETAMENTCQTSKVRLAETWFFFSKYCLERYLVYLVKPVECTVFISSLYQNSRCMGAPMMAESPCSQASNAVCQGDYDWELEAYHERAREIFNRIFAPNWKVSSDTREERK